MMRSGTTLLQRLLARDPRFSCAYGWEIGEPAPRPGTVWTRARPAHRRRRGARAADARASRRSSSPSIPRTRTRPTRRSSSSPTRSSRTSPRPRATSPSTAPGSTTRTSRPPIATCGACSSCSSGRSGSAASTRERWVLKTPAHLGYLDTLLRRVPRRARRPHAPRARSRRSRRVRASTPRSGRCTRTTSIPHEVGRQWLERMGWTTRRALAARDAAARRRERFTDVVVTATPSRTRSPRRARSTPRSGSSSPTRPARRDGALARARTRARSRRRTRTRPSSSA